MLAIFRILAYSSIQIEKATQQKAPKQTTQQTSKATKGDNLKDRKNKI